MNWKDIKRRALATAWQAGAAALTIFATTVQGAVHADQALVKTAIGAAVGAALSVIKNAFVQYRAVSVVGVPVGDHGPEDADVA